MDIKIVGITEEIMRGDRGKEKGGRKHILGERGKEITEGRSQLGEFAPRI